MSNIILPGQLDYMIVKDRNIPPDLSNLPIIRGNPKFLYPESQCRGYREFTLRSLRLWQDPKQIAFEYIKCGELCESMLEKISPCLNGLDTCLSMHDGYAIEKRMKEIEDIKTGQGLEFFRKYFKSGSGVFFLKSAVEVEIKEKGVWIHYRCAPYLSEFGLWVKFRWRWFEDYVIWTDVIPRFRDGADKKPIPEPRRQFEIIHSSRVA